MANRDLTQRSLIRSRRRALAGLFSPRRGRLYALVLEWQSRRKMACILGQLSSASLRDIGLTKADVYAACADSFNQPASLALATTAQSRMGNW